MIRSCSCPANKSDAAKFQDDKYKGQRVFTEAAPGKKAHCTICSAAYVVEK